MDADVMTVGACAMRMDQAMFDAIHAHLFPGDGDEHGAVIEAGVSNSGSGLVLVARALRLAREGVDWLPGERGYRMMPAGYIRKRIRACRDENLVYLAVHNHGGTDSVGFSRTDFESHERGFPALLDITGRNLPVGALVFAPNAVAGDIWLANGARLTLSSLTVVGARRRVLTARPRAPGGISPRFDRQVRLFGDKGQAILAGAKVGIIGLGGVGSLLAEILGRLGVGAFVLIDPDRADPTNLPRLVDATDWDAMTLLRRETNPAWLRDLGARLATPKIDISRRVILKANRRAKITRLLSRMEERACVEALKDCDYIFLAADGHRARRLFNAMAHQYLIPGAQLGARIQTNPDGGEIENVHTTVRLVTPNSGCLICNQAINTARLQEESTPEPLRRRQKYTDDVEVVAPSVITLNALTAGQAANDFLFYLTGMTNADAFGGYIQSHPRIRRQRFVTPRKDSDCPDCGETSESRRARGDTLGLPLID